MGWFRFESKTPQHPKVYALARELGLDRFSALGCLAAFWSWVCEYAPDGDLSGCCDEAIEDGFGWDGEPGAFMGALRRCGLIDETPGGQAVHDWMEYARQYRAALRKRKERRSKESGGTLYAGVLPDGGIRIGFTRSLARRLAELASAGTPLEGVLSCESTEGVRLVLQTSLSKYRRGRQEVYDNEPGVWEAIQAAGLTPLLPLSQPGHNPVTPKSQLSGCSGHKDETGRDVKDLVPNNSSGLVPEQPDGSPEPAVLVFPCKGKAKTWNLSKAQVAEWQKLYSVDVLTEARLALAWAKANPRKQKTARGMPSFLVTWLGKSQDNGRKDKPHGPSSPAIPKSAGYPGRPAEDRDIFG